MRTAKELVATGRENDGSDMPRRAAFPHLLPGFRNPTPYKRLQAGGLPCDLLTDPDASCPILPRLVRAASLVTATAIAIEIAPTTRPGGVPYLRAQSTSGGFVSFCWRPSTSIVTVAFLKVIPKLHVLHTYASP